MKRLLIVLLLPAISNAQGLDFLNKWKKAHEARIEKKQAKRKQIWDQESVYQLRLLGIAFQTQQNTNFSKNQYSGPQLSIASQKTVTRKKHETVSTSQLGLGILGIDNYNGFTYSFASQVDYGYLFKMIKGVSFGPNLGFTSNVRLNSDFENNALGMETGLDIGAKARISKDFNVFGMAFKAQYMLTVPVGAVMLSLPSRTNSVDEYGLLGGFRSIKGYQRIGSNLQLAFQHSNRFPNRHLALNYQWNAQRIGLNEEKFAAVASHQIGFIGNLTKVK